MKLTVRILIGLLIVGFVWWLSQAVASESGEVVVLTTHAGAGHETTRLWVVDHEGQAWLRAGSAQAGWYQRLVQRPDVAVERDGATMSFRAEPVADQRDEINRLIREKYGWADAYIGFWFGREDAIPIRLVPG